MSQQTIAPKASPLRVLLGIVAAAAVGFGIAILYLLILRKVVGIGRGMDGLALAASLMLFPIVSGLLGPVTWLPLMLWRKSKGLGVSGALTLGAGALVGLLAGLVFTGAAGFKLSGGAPAMNYAFPALGACGAWAFHALARKAF